jgi:hypothetical protein
MRRLVDEYEYEYEYEYANEYDDGRERAVGRLPG